jgi:hypothetical protein
MTLTFSPPDGYRNVTSFPTKPANETEFRNQMMTLLDQIRDYLNGGNPFSQYVRKSGDTMTGNLAFNALRGLESRSGNSDTSMDLVDFPEVTSAFANIRVFRGTNTTGDKIIQICRGNGSSEVDLQILNGQITRLNSLPVSITAGSNPEGNIVANPGSIHLRTTAASQQLYVKLTGTGNTGWAGVATV